MAAPKTAAQKGTQRQRMLNGEPVKTVLYNGRSVGHGKYFTGEVGGNLICDDTGKPLPITDIGQLV
jgi:hypothetical protein